MCRIAGISNLLDETSSDAITAISGMASLSRPFPAGHPTCETIGTPGRSEASGGINYLDPQVGFLNGLNALGSTFGTFGTAGTFGTDLTIAYGLI
jgi:hypothetical protein